MKKPKSEPNLFKQNHKQNYDDGRGSILICEMCCCASCTGFGCPWVNRTGHIPDIHKLSKRPKRCGVCFRDNRYKRILDCDFYSYYKRKRYYVPRKVYRRKLKIDLIAEKLDKIIKKLDGDG